MWWLVIARERIGKQGLVANSFAEGMVKLGVQHHVCINDPPNLTDPFLASGQLWVVERIVPPAMQAGRPFWLVDNGYYKTSGRGHGHDGHYELTYRGLTPVLLQDPDYDRFPAEKVLKPWNPKPKGYVLLALPGESFGKMIGLDMRTWMRNIKARIRRHTDRPILVREKWCKRSLEGDLEEAFVVVTHSSNVAVDAMIHGVPAIVAPTNPAAPVCSQKLSSINDPWMPDRTHWWASLMNQQFTVAEMRSGFAWQSMQRIAAQVDRA